MRSVAILILAAGAYGFSIGLAHSVLYAERNLVKLPALLLVTALTCAPAYFVVTLFCGVRLPFRRVLNLALELFSDAAVLLASLTPANLFVALTILLDDEPSLRNYDFFLKLNIGFVALCGSVALVRQARELLRSASVQVSRSVAIVGLWLLLSLVVGGQASFYLRPMFGYPSSRGQEAPWLLGSQADPRGATNFFEVVLQSVRQPPMPSED